MRIIYGVQGTGNGHLSRSRDMVRELKALGHHVFVIVSGRHPDKLWEMDVFEPYTVFPGLTFVTHRGRIKRYATWRQLRLRRFYADVKSLDCRSYDVAITDYEPILARAAKRVGIPVIGLGHQYAFCHSVPMARGDFLSRVIMTRFAPVEVPLGLHYHHFDCPILPPIVPRHLKPSQEAIANKVVVYLPFEDPTEIRSFLAEFPHVEFFIYGHGSQTEDIGHLHYRPPSRNGFLRDVIQAAGVFAGAGFALSSECLHMGKKLLAKPVAGQIEQEYNALALEKLGLGCIMRVLDQALLADWLAAPHFEAQNYPDVAQIVAQWISDYPRANLQDLIHTVWEKVPLPAVS